MEHQARHISAAALAGGKSRRMGTDKALLPLAEGSQPMLGIALAVLSDIADDVFIVASNRERYTRFGFPIASDSYPEIGALGGIHAAISRAVHGHCLVVACDMPFLNPSLLRRMAAEPRDYDVLVPVIPGESRQRGNGLVFQTLHAIYSKRCLPAIEQRIAAGNKQVVGFFEDVRVRTIDAAEVARWDPDLRSFFNANTPRALSEAALISEQMEPNQGP